MKAGRIKVEIAVGKGKKFHDKRESERVREMQEEAKAGVASGGLANEDNTNQVTTQVKSMKLSILTSPAEQVVADALAVLAFEQSEVAAVEEPTLAEQNGWLAELRASGEFKGKLYDIAVLHRPAGVAAKRLVVVGAGKKEKLTTVEIRRVAGTLVRSLKSKGVKQLALVLEGAAAGGSFVQAAVEGAVLGGWEADKYKTESKKDEPAGIESVALVLRSGEALQGGHAEALEAALDQGLVIAEAQNFTRDLVNEPANLLTPAKLAEAASQMAAEYNLACEVLDRDAMAALGMGALLGVAQGSVEPPYLIVVKYQPIEPRSKAHLALVGKGVTFDTGGVSIKASPLTAWKR